MTYDRKIRSFHLFIFIDSGFVFNKSQSIVLTVKYKTEKRVHKEQSGVLMYISTQP